MTKRPFLVWVIFVFCMASIAINALILIPSIFGIEIGGGGNVARINALTVIDLVTGVVGLIFNLLGIVDLIRLKKRSFVWLFLAILLNVVDVFLWLFGFKEWNAVPNAGFYAGQVIALLICIYVYVIRARGVLS